MLTSQTLPCGVFTCASGRAGARRGPRQSGAATAEPEGGSPEATEEEEATPRARRPLPQFVVPNPLELGSASEEAPGRSDVVLTDLDPSLAEPYERPVLPFFGREEEFHCDFSGLEYDPSLEQPQEVVIAGHLAPPGWDAEEPLAGAPSPQGWPLLLLLPAEGATEVREPASAALTSVQKTGFHTTGSGCHVVQLAFPFLPEAWCADGPTDDGCRESFLVQVLLPYLNKTLGIAPGSAYLLGYAHGGWGCVSLLLRHPQHFAAAACWDAPLLPIVPDGRLPGMLETFIQNSFYQPHVLLDIVEDPWAAARLGSLPAARLLSETGKPVPEGDAQRLLAAGQAAAAAARAAAAAGEDKEAAAEEAWIAVGDTVLPRLALFTGRDESNAEDAEFLSRVMISMGIPHVYEDRDARTTNAPRGWSTEWLVPALNFLLTRRGRTGEEAFEQHMAEVAAAEARAKAAEERAERRAAAAAEAAAAEAAEAAGAAAGARVLDGYDNDEESETEDGGDTEDEDDFGSDPIDMSADFFEEEAPGGAVRSLDDGEAAGWASSGEDSAP